MSGRKRRTHEQFIEEMEQINPNIKILGKYQTSKTKIKCLCDVHNFEWEATPSNLLSGRSCIYCGKEKNTSKQSKTNDMFIQELSVLHPHINPLEPYVNSHSKIKCKCLLHDYIWNVAPGQLLQGGNCPLCANERRGLKTRKSDNEFQKELKLVNPNIVTLEKYQGANKKILCKCLIHDYEWRNDPTHLLRGYGCPDCKKDKKHKALTKSHEVFIQEMVAINTNIEILDKYQNDYSYVTCRCLVDGYIWKATPSNLLRGKGCPVCGNNKVLEGVNDVATLRPDLVQYFKNPHVAKTVSLYSQKKIECICPKCKHTDHISVNALTISNGYSCPLCSDGISYPNKFSRVFLSQLPINNLQFEWSPEWAFNYRYDNYFEYDGKSYVLEMDGGFHYIDNPFNGESKDVVKEIDSEKDFLAKNHNINIIRIDSRKSTKEYLSFNILHSDLNTIFDLSNINWNECDLYAKSSIFIKVCETFKEEKLNTKSLAKKFNISISTVVKYLNSGTKLNLCNYIPRDSKRKSVAVYDSDRHLLFNFNSISECSNLLQEKFNKKFYRNYIREVCLGIRTLYNDLYFEFI